MSRRDVVRLCTTSTYSAKFHYATLEVLNTAGSLLKPTPVPTNALAPILAARAYLLNPGWAKSWTAAASTAANLSSGPVRSLNKGACHGQRQKLHDHFDAARRVCPVMHAHVLSDVVREEKTKHEQQ